MEKIIIGNLKMNLLSPIERDRYIEDFKKEIKISGVKDAEVVLCVPTVHLENFAKKLKHKILAFGAQNIFWEDKGSYTGEISPLMVKNAGGEYVILGHSERRRYLGETDEAVNLKVVAALKNGLKVVLCVGEDGEQKKNGTGEETIMEQLEGCLKNVSLGKINGLKICYEPVWAISANKPDHLPTDNEIMSARLLIRKYLTLRFGKNAAEKVRIIYGGSVEAGNIKQVCLDPGMDGVLVGKESLDPKSFMKIVKTISNA